jgi:uncharacterized protein (TIGR02118 family)
MIVTVAYPKTKTSTFDLDYYVHTHVPLVNRLWGPLGLRGAQVLKGTGSLGGAPIYELICLLDFESQDAFNQAAGAHADDVMGDIRNFTNVEPIVQFNETVAA